MASDLIVNGSGVESAGLGVLETTSKTLAVGFPAYNDSSGSIVPPTLS